MSKLFTITVDNTNIHIEDDYICLTDMVKTAKNGTRAADLLRNWLNTVDTIDYLAAWEGLSNTNFKVLEFQHFRESVRTKRVTLSVASWVEGTDAIGIYSRLGKRGGTYAHKDIAFEFGTAISPAFKLHLIREYQRLKEAENNPQTIEWQLRRMMAKTLYVVQTDAVQTYKLPKCGVNLSQIRFAYAEEADILNYALFGFSAKQWRESHPDLEAKGENVRNYACTNELIILGSLEGMNAQMLKEDLPYAVRLKRLKDVTAEQLPSLNKKYPAAAFRKNLHGELKDPISIGMFPRKQVANG